MKLLAGMDTIGLTQDQIPLDYDRLVSNGFTEVVSRKMQDGEITATQKYFLNTGKYRIDVGSARYQIELSLPKLRSADNITAVPFQEVEDFVYELSEEVTGHLGQVVDLYSQARPYRLDYAFDFQGVGDRRSYIDAFGMLCRLPRGHKAVYGDGESLLGWTKSMAVRMYDKYLESGGNPQAKDVMRLECSVRGVSGVVRNVLAPGEGNMQAFTRSVRLGDVATRQAAAGLAGRIWQKGLKGVGQVRRSRADLLLEYLVETYGPGPACRLFGFASILYRYGDKWCLANYPKTTFYRLRSEWARTGLVLTDLEEVVECDFRPLIREIKKLGMTA